MRPKLNFCTHTAVAALLLGLTGAAYAQEAGTVETVTVTGYRASLANALQAKQNANLIMESVAEEDIGKMPDQDVAESLQRLPGVQINRDQGKGSTVLINGLRQNLITLNGDVFLTGREFYTYGEASGGGSGGNFQYDSLSTIPSEEIGGVDVYKSPNAALTEGGMGGILNLKTRDPLTSPDGISVTANVRGTSSSYQSLANTTPNATLVASYKPSSTFAVTGSISYDDVNTRTKEMESYNRSPWVLTQDAVSGYTGVGPLLPCSGTPLVCPSGQTKLATQYLMPEYMYWSNVFDQSKTTGATAGVTWAPTEAITTSVVWFFSHNWDRTTNYSNKIGFNGSGSTSNVLGSGPPGIDADLPYSINADGTVQSATFYVTGAETATLLTVQNSDANNLQWHTSIDSGGPITATFDVAYSRATSQFSAAQQDIDHGLYTPQAGYAAGTPQALAPGCNNFAASCTTGNPAMEVEYTNGGDSGLPTAKYIGTYADVLSNPNYAIFKSAWGWANKAKEEQGAIRGAVEYKPAFLGGVDGTITGGFRIATRNIWQNFGRYLIDGLDVNGNYIQNCCYGQGNGAGLYYQDPGYAAIPFSTATSSPNLALTVDNFMFGDMIVKNPVTGGMQSPATFLNTVWNTASYVPGVNGVPAGKPSAVVVNGTAVPCTGAASDPAACSVAAATKVPNSSEAFYADTLSSFRVHESTQAFYLMTDLGNKDKGFHINAGVRVVFTNQVVTGATSAPTVYSYGTATWNGVNSNNVPFTAGHYTVDILPSVNISLYPTDDQIIRLSAARVMSPADLFNLGDGQSYNFTRETGGRINIHTGVADGFKFATGSSGNPNLDPYRATQFNLDWEYYFAPQALLSVGGFYKQIESFEVNQPVNTLVPDDFGGTEGPITMPVNGGHGQIYGMEFAGQYVLDMGLGVAANYTYTQSQSVIQTAFSKHLPIPGVAAHAATATVFYENYGVDARVSYSWRSSTVNGTIAGATFSPTNTSTGSTVDYGVFTAPYGEVDAQVLYNFTDYLAAYVGGQNLTNEASHMYLQFKDQPFIYDDSGTRYFFGVRVRY